MNELVNITMHSIEAYSFSPLSLRKLQLLLLPLYRSPVSVSRFEKYLSFSDLSARTTYPIVLVFELFVVVLGKAKI